MTEKKTVAFRLDESVKEEWEEAAEGPEYDSLSHLIRLSVQKEITDTETAQTDTQAGVSIDGDSEVLDSLTRLERTVEDIQDEMKAVSRERQSEELYDLEQVLLEILPAYDPSMYDFQNPTDIDIDTLTPQEAADRIGADEQDVSDALNRLSDNTAQVRRIDAALPSAGHEVGYVRVE